MLIETNHSPARRAGVARRWGVESRGCRIRDGSANLSRFVVVERLCEPTSLGL